ncbi:uncharacterized protein LOC141849330 [Brevipalpus obovatus]|uniref:uncharacterized protein LOC141849330 n=1 Tax=Brevipalpus obovatus TaxID=246614 RepID=UPI003D9E8678
MRFCHFSTVFVTISIYILEVRAKDDSQLSNHQIGRLCSTINKKMLMRQNETEIGKFLDEEIERMGQSVGRKKSKSKGKDQNYPDDDGQIVALKSDGTVGENGLYFQVRTIGTDASTSNDFVSLVLQQMSNNIVESDMSDTSVSAYPTVAMRGHSGETNMNEHWYSTIMAKSGHGVHIPFGKCRNMIETIYNRRHHGIQSRNSIGKSSPTSIQQKSAYNDGGNSTSIREKMNIAADGTGIIIDHIATGESTLSTSATQEEDQNHGSYKNSKVSLTDIVVPIIISG